MSPDEIMVLAVGVGAIIFVIWFFFMKKERRVEAESGRVRIVVEGGYSPDTIVVEKDRETVLSFIRKDPNSCLEEVVIPDLGQRAYLPLNKEVDLKIRPKRSGRLVFSCGMNMFHGKIIVEDKE